MKPTDFVKSREWKHQAAEARLECAAVFLPVLIYILTLFIGDFGLAELKRMGVKIDVSHLLEIPDALFGGCILFSFGVIRARDASLKLKRAGRQPFEGIYVWRNMSLLGVISCSILSSISVLFHVKWSLGAGLIAIYLGYQCFKNITFYRSYLDASA